MLGAIGVKIRSMTECADTITKLKELNPRQADCVIVHGYHEPGDGGGGSFFWDSSFNKNLTQFPEGEDFGTTIKPNSLLPSQVGRWRRIYDGPISVKWFGATGDGFKLDTDAIQNAINVVQPGDELIIPAGTYKLSSLHIKSTISLRGIGKPKIISEKVSNSIGGNLALLVIDGGEPNAKYLRITINGNTQNQLVSIFEIKIYGLDKRSTGDSGCSSSLPVLSVTANGSEPGHPAIHAIDDIPDTRWSNIGKASWLQFDLSNEQRICGVGIKWYLGDKLVYPFTISVSTNGTDFVEVYSGKSSGTTLAEEKYYLKHSPLLGDVKISNLEVKYTGGMPAIIPPAKTRPLIDGILAFIDGGLKCDNLEVSGVPHSGIVGAIGEYILENVYCHDNGYAGAFFVGLGVVAIPGCRFENNGGWKPSASVELDKFDLKSPAMNYFIKSDLKKYGVSEEGYALAWPRFDGKHSLNPTQEDIIKYVQEKRAQFADRVEIAIKYSNSIAFYDSVRKS